MHGFSTIYLLFGPEDAERLLGVDNAVGINTKWALGLPLIPLALIAARTRYADNLLPILPIFYFASTGPQRDGPLWPPSASMTVAILPYVRAAYNEFYDRVCAPREKAWIKQIQPRAGDPEGNGDNGEHDHNQGQANEFEDGMDIGLDLQVEILEDEGHEDRQPAGNAPREEQGQANQGQDRGQDQNQDRNQPAAGDQAHAPNLDQHLHQHQHQHQHQRQNQNGVQGLVLNNFFSLPQTIMGALVFPTISAAMGALLQVALPRSWTTAPSRWDRYPAGFLQSRFGRSVIGGCLFVVLKDTLMLYSRYRLAQDHKKRKVVDYDPKKGKKGGDTR